MILSELSNCLESESQEISSFSLYYANNFKETDKNNKDFLPGPFVNLPSQLPKMTIKQTSGPTDWLLVAVKFDLIKTKNIQFSVARWNYSSGII